MIRIIPLVAGGLLLAATTANAQKGTKLAVIPTQFDDSARGMVPSLFDDYLLTAVQNTVNAEVIGQEDISALLGFEEQRDLLDCSDTSCIADIGGALGVDKIVVVKIAHLGEDWIATAKIINIRETRVESRVNEIVSGNVKQLLTATPRIVAKLFGTSVPAPTGTTTTPATHSSTPTPSPSTSATSPPTVKRVPNAGSGNRVGGLVMLLGGALVSSIGQLVLMAAYFDGAEEAIGLYAGSLLTYVGGQVVQGIGTKLRANGSAQGQLGDPNAYGKPAVYWLGWTMAASGWLTGAAGPWLVSDSDMLIIGALCGLASLGFSLAAHVIFFIGGFGGHTNMRASAAPELSPNLRFVRAPGGGVTPTYGLSLSF